MKFARTLNWTLGLALVAMCASVAAHERKEVAGLDVVFGAEPEPCLDRRKTVSAVPLSVKGPKEPFGDYSNA